MRFRSKTDEIEYFKTDRDCWRETAYAIQKQLNAAKKQAGEEK